MQEAIAVHAKLLDVSLTEARKDAESIINGMMKDEKCSREFAESTFIEDIEDANPDEIKAMEMNAKKNGTLKIGARLCAENKKGARARKPNNDKRLLIQALVKAIESATDSTIDVAESEEHKIDFSYGAIEYTVSLTAHRAKKEKEKG